MERWEIPGQAQDDVLEVFRYRIDTNRTKEKQNSGVPLQNPTGGFADYNQIAKTNMERTAKGLNTLKDLFAHQI